ncbi:triose-phosphate isomerase [Candidatus Puniceispirillum sp.]|nr:triose-phosphate isomerase [Candidatus Puniceispirillum sp.]
MIIAANWKMNPSLKDAGGLANALNAKIVQPVTRILLAPHTYLIPMSIRLQGSDIRLGGQDCHQAADGAHTGDVSAAMLRDCGASVVLLGHSERRINHGEKSRLVAEKAKQAIVHGMDVIVCLGETLGERHAGQAEQVVIDQLRASVPDEIPRGQLMIAYEPVWAIGTGEVASLADIAAMHDAIASELPKNQRGDIIPNVPILYGGSVNAENAASIFSLDNVGGGLIGGASLDAEAFDLICESARSQMLKSEFVK